MLFLTCGIASAFDLFGDGLEPEDIYVDRFVCEPVNYSSTNFNRYVYDVSIDLYNVSSSLKGSEVVTYFYSNDTLITNNDTFNVNLTVIDDSVYSESSKHLYVWHKIWTDHYVNITSCDIVILKDGKVIFNETKPYYMGNFKDESELSTSSSIDDSHDSSSSSSSSGTFVASSNSNKFHEPYCSQAQKISDANKITFSSREEAINAGYEQCEICYP